MAADPRDVEEQNRRQHRRGHDVDVADTQHFGHQEGTCPHDGRHDLTAGGRDGFDGGGEAGGIAQPLHRRDCDSADRGDNGGGGAGNRAVHGRGEHAHFRGTCPVTARHARGQRHEAGAGFARGNQRSENQKDRDDVDQMPVSSPHNPPSAMTSVPKRIKRDAVMAEFARDVLTEKSVDQRDQRCRRQHGLDRAAPSPARRESERQRAQIESRPAARRIDRAGGRGRR